MSNTAIEWTDKVWNPVTGCTKISAGCKNCYAERMFHRPYPGRDFGDVRCHPERLDYPLRFTQPWKFFVNSISDLFHEKVPLRFIAEVFETMASYRLLCRKREHDHDGDCWADWRPIYQVLTKRPERMLEILRPGGLLDQDVSENWPGDSPLSLAMECEWPLKNVWLGVSVEDQKTADERIPLLLQSPAAVRWVSYEPALGPVDFIAYMDPSCTAFNRLDGAHVDWLVAGGESGPHARPSHPDWFRSVRDQCQAAGVPFFFKQWGEWTPGSCPEFGGSLESRKIVFNDGGTCAVCENDLKAAVNVRGIGNEATIMSRPGKKRAGRLLDGREWNEFPGGVQQSPPCRNCGHGRAQHFGSDPECRCKDCSCEGYEAQA